MIEWLIGFLVAKWWLDKEEKKGREAQEQQREIAFQVPFGYLKNDETIGDLI